MNLAERCEGVWPLRWRQNNKHGREWTSATVPGHTLIVSEDTSKYYTEYTVSLCAESLHPTVTNMSSDNLLQLCRRAREHIVNNPPHIPELL